MVQPQLTGWQREVRLNTEDVKWARADGVDRVLAEFPLPGAQTGRPTYLLYLRASSGVKTAHLDSKADGKAGTNTQGQGFMIQTRGEYAGLARLSNGTLRMHGPSLLNARKQRIEVDVTCEDGTRMIGDLTATRDDYLVSRFETKQRPADVQALLKTATSAPAAKH
jgi:hypothetical protein